MARRPLLPALALALVTGCGGGSGGGSAGTPDDGAATRPAGSDRSASLPAAPALELNVEAIKTFRFSWGDVAGAEHYRLLENPDGVSGYTEVKRLLGDARAHEHEVFLPGRVRSIYLLQACNAAGCTDSPPVAPVDVLAAGAGYFKDLFSESGDLFGAAVAASADGEDIAVGLPGDDGGGSVFVFTRYPDSGVWSGQRVTAVAGGDFGYAVDLSEDGNVLVVGAPGAGVGGGAYVFDRAGPGFSWREDGSLMGAIDDALNVGDFFGSSVAISVSGDGTRTVAVGAEWRDAGGSIRGGAAYVFRGDGSGNWHQEAYLGAPDPTNYAEFGRVVELSADGKGLAVGAPLRPAGDPGSDRGAAHVYRLGDAGVWEHEAIFRSEAATHVEFGFTVALDAAGDTLAVGAPEEADSGRVHFFQRSGAGGGWTRHPAFAGEDSAAGDRFGTSVALAGDGRLLAVGAQAHGGAGAAYTFVSDGSGSWPQQTKIIPAHGDEDDGFGHALAVARDGESLAVGAHYEDSDANFIGNDPTSDSANQSGAMYLY